MQPPLFNIFFYPSFTDSFDHRILFPHYTSEYPPEPGPPRKHWEILSLRLFPLVPRISSCSKEPANLRMLAGHFGPKSASPQAKSAGWSPELQKQRKLQDTRQTAARVPLAGTDAVNLAPVKRLPWH